MSLPSALTDKLVTRDPDSPTRKQQKIKNDNITV